MTFTIFCFNLIELNLFRLMCCPSTSSIKNYFYPYWSIVIDVTKFWSGLIFFYLSSFFSLFSHYHLHILLRLNYFLHAFHYILKCFSLVTILKVTLYQERNALNHSHCFIRSFWLLLSFCFSSVFIFYSIIVLTSYSLFSPLFCSSFF